MYLGIDTTNNNLCYALLDSQKNILFFENIYPCHTAAEILAPKIQNLLNRFSITIHNIQQIICVNGPGGFSGVRIGTSFITGLTIQQNIPIIGLSSLQALALSVSEPTKDSIIISCLDARRESIYLGIYQSDYTPILTDRLIAYHDIEKTLLEFDKNFYTLYGHGNHIIRSFLSPEYMLNNLDDLNHDYLHYPKAELFTQKAHLIQNIYHNNQPIYLRQPDAKLATKKRIVTSL